MKLVVIGGGLVGCLLTLYLAKRGHEVHIFERAADGVSAASSKRPSINLTLCERGLRPLQAVGLRDSITALCVPAFGRRMHALDGSVAYQPYGNNGEAIYSISRTDLNDALLEAARAVPNIHLHFNNKFVSMDISEGTARFENTADGTVEVAKADHLFAADGAYSAVRGHLQRTERLNYSQQYWDQGYKELNIAARPGDTWAFEPDSLHVWPRGHYMLIAFANRDHSFTCSLHIPFRGSTSHESLRNPEDLNSFLNSAFPDAASLLSESATRFFAKAPNTMLTVRCDPWSFGGRVCLIGDAAHAMLPSYGQGANAGFEDVALLDSFIEASPNDWGNAFAHFESHRRPDMDAMADLCIEHFNELREHVADPNFLRRRETERRLNQLYPDTYEPLYSMVTFTVRRYAEAIAIDRRQRIVLDHLLADRELGAEIGQPGFERTLREMITAAG